MLELNRQERYGILVALEDREDSLIAHGRTKEAEFYNALICKLIEAWVIKKEEEQNG